MSGKKDYITRKAAQLFSRGLIAKSYESDPESVRKEAIRIIRNEGWRSPNDTPYSRKLLYDYVEKFASSVGSGEQTRMQKNQESNYLSKYGEISSKSSIEGARDNRVYVSDNFGKSLGDAVYDNQYWFWKDSAEFVNDNTLIDTWIVDVNGKKFIYDSYDELMFDSTDLNSEMGDADLGSGESTTAYVNGTTATIKIG